MKYGCPICGRTDWNCGKLDCPNVLTTDQLQRLSDWVTENIDPEDLPVRKDGRLQCVNDLPSSTA
jgi:hypothetical protein